MKLLGKLTNMPQKIIKIISTQTVFSILINISEVGEAGPPQKAWTWVEPHARKTGAKVKALSQVAFSSPEVYAAYTSAQFHFTSTTTKSDTNIQLCPELCPSWMVTSRKKWIQQREVSKVGLDKRSPLTSSWTRQLQMESRGLLQICFSRYSMWFLPCRPRS